jgi:hypothetical protein
VFTAKSTDLACLVTGRNSNCAASERMLRNPERTSVSVGVAEGEAQEVLNQVVLFA